MYYGVFQLAWVILHAALEGYIINTIIIILYAKMTLTLVDILMWTERHSSSEGKGQIWYLLFKLSRLAEFSVNLKSWFMASITQVSAPSLKSLFWSDKMEP